MAPLAQVQVSAEITFANTLAYWVSGGSTVVERLPHYPKAEGSRQATAVGTGGKNG